MSKIKESISLCIIVNAAVLSAIFFVIKNLDYIFTIFSGAVNSLVSAFMPLFIGILLAYLISPLADIIDTNVSAKLTAKFRTDDPIKTDRMLKKRYLVSIFIAFAIILIALIILVYALAVLIGGTLQVGSLYESIESIIAYFNSFQQAALQTINNLPDERLKESALNIYNFAMSRLSQGFSGGRLISLARSITSSVINIGIGSVISIYILNDKEYFHRIWRKLLHLALPQKQNAIVTETLHEINEVLSLFLRGAMIDSLIVALLSSAALSLYGLPYAVFIGCFTGITNIIPYFGPFFGMAAAFIVSLFSKNIVFGIGSAIILFIIQQIDCNIIYPKIVGQSTGLHPLFVLLAASVLGYYGGIIGMIIAVPLAGISRVLIIRLTAS